MSNVAFKQSLSDFCNLGLTSAINAGKSADVYLYGVVGGSKVNADTLQTTLDSLGEVDVINVHINTLGGTFSEGLAIYNILKSHKAFIVVKVMGYCLSMGSHIMLAADRVECAENGLIMIHRAQGFTFGCVDEHQKAISTLLKHEKTFMPMYRVRLSKTEAEVLMLLKAETWYTASEAKSAGLVDVVFNGVEIDEKASNAGASGLNVTVNYRGQHRLTQSILQMVA